MSETIITKRCSTCKQTKPISEFYKNKAMKDGFQNQCKICHYKANQKYMQTEKGKATCRKKYRKHNKTEKGKFTHKKYNQSEKGKLNNRRNRKRHRLAHPDREKARNIANRAVANNKLPRPNTLKCKYCPEQAEQYHHPDYSKPFDVESICRGCHIAIPA